MLRAIAGAILLPVAVLAAETFLTRIYVAPDDHTDYLWSADEATYRRAFLEMIDYYLDQADRTAGAPPDHQSRWNCDGSFWMWTYERSRTAAEFERFMRRVRDGHMGVPLNPLATVYGGTPAEAILRGMYYSGRIERRYGVRFPIAIAMENSTLPFGLGALWAGAGARYSWKGICGCASKLGPVSRQLRPHEIYWWQGLDGSRILMKWNSLLRPGKGANQCIGGYAEAFDPAASVRYVETDERFRSAWPFSIVGIFGQGWDHLTTTDTRVMDAARAMTTPTRRIVVSNQEDFFRDFERRYGARLPAFSAAFGNEWELYTASLAEVSARMRRVTEKLRAAEALATLVSLKRPEFLRGREEARDRAFMDLGLYWEHNWTNDGPVTRQAHAAWSRRLAFEVEDYVDHLESDAALALGSMIRRHGANRRFYVFNPLSWTRSDVADIPYDGPAEIRVIDLESGEEVPAQMATLNFRDYVKGQRHLRILARDIPPVGYKVYEIRAGAPASWPDAPSASGDTIENALYRLTVSGRGAITSMRDRRRGGREWSGAGAGRPLNDLGPGQGVLGVENAGAVSVTLKAAVQAPLARTARITLYRGIDRVDIVNEICENFSDVRAWQFGFNVEAPDVWHEEVGAVIRARLSSGGGHYSPVHSRLDWLSLNHFASMSGADGAGVTLSSADLAFMKLGNSEVVNGVSRLDTSTPLISVLAGGQVDGPKLGIPAQGGDSYFLQRFALRAYNRFDAAASMRFAMEHQNPLRAAYVRGGGDYPETSFSLFKLQGEDTLLWALKPSEDGIARGVVARVWNLAPEPRPITIELAGGIGAAERITHIETAIGPAPVANGALAATLRPSQMVSFRLMRPPVRRGTGGPPRVPPPPRR